MLAVQPELDRFIDDWNQNETLEARTEVYLDQTMIAKAGPPHPFGTIYSTIREESRLPSGSLIRVRVDLSKGKYWLQMLLEGAAIESLILALFLLLKRRLGRVSAELSEPIEETARWIQSISGGLPASASHVEAVADSKVAEVQNVRASVLTLAHEIAKLEGNLAQTHFDRGRLEMADQVAHDIRAPLASMAMCVSMLKGASREEREELRGLIQRMQDIANTLLDARREERSRKPRMTAASAADRGPTALAPALLLPLVEQVVSEKRKMQFDRPLLKIEGPEASHCYAACAAMVPAELQRVLSNLMDNAIESITGEGWVLIKLSQDDERVRLEVSDTGKGMTAEEVERVLEQSESIDKPTGSGIGLAHAQATMHAWGGRLMMTSTPGMGTSVALEWESAKLPESLLPILHLKSGASVAIVDDDPSIHLLWKSRWDALGLGAFCRLETFFKSKDLISRLRDGATPPPALYLVDYDLGPGETNGIDLIAQLDLAAQAVLVSSRVEDPEIIARCAELNLRRLPKAWAGVIPIEAHFDFTQANGAAIGQGPPEFPLQTLGCPSGQAVVEVRT